MLFRSSEKTMGVQGGTLGSGGEVAKSATGRGGEGLGDGGVVQSCGSGAVEVRIGTGRKGAESDGVKPVITRSGFEARGAAGLAPDRAEVVEEGVSKSESAERSAGAAGGETCAGSGASLGVAAIGHRAPSLWISLMLRVSRKISAGVPVDSSSAFGHRCGSGTLATVSQLRVMSASRSPTRASSSSARSSRSRSRTLHTTGGSPALRKTRRRSRALSRRLCRRVRSAAVNDSADDECTSKIAFLAVRRAVGETESEVRGEMGHGGEGDPESSIAPGRAGGGWGQASVDLVCWADCWAGREVDAGRERFGEVYGRKQRGDQRESM